MAKKILVVDDEPDLLKVTALRLKKTGYDVVVGIDGREAMDLAHQAVPDLMILDVYLPVMNGDEVARILKQEEAMKHIPIILISATMESLPARAKESMADSYLIKPFTPEQLLSEVKRLIG